MAATAAMQLYEQGRLKLDVDIRTHHDRRRNRGETHEPFPRYVSEQIFHPLQMTRSAFEQPSG